MTEPEFDPVVNKLEAFRRERERQEAEALSGSEAEPVYKQPTYMEEIQVVHSIAEKLQTACIDGIERLEGISTPLSQELKVELEALQRQNAFYVNLLQSVDVENREGNALPEFPYKINSGTMFGALKNSAEQTLKSISPWIDQVEHPLTVQPKDRLETIEQQRGDYEWELVAAWEEYLLYLRPPLHPVPEDRDPQVARLRLPEEVIDLYEQTPFSITNAALEQLSDRSWWVLGKYPEAETDQLRRGIMKMGEEWSAALMEGRWRVPWLHNPYTGIQRALKIQKFLFQVLWVNNVRTLAENDMWGQREEYKRWFTSLRQLNERLRESIVKLNTIPVLLAFCGMVDGRKSNLINTLIGQDVLPLNVTPYLPWPCRIRHTPKEKKPRLTINERAFAGAFKLLQEIQYTKLFESNNLEGVSPTLRTQWENMPSSMKQSLRTFETIGFSLPSSIFGIKGVKETLRLLNDFIRICEAFSIELDHGSYDNWPVISVECEAIVLFAMKGIEPDVGRKRNKPNIKEGLGWQSDPEPYRCVYELIDLPALERERETTTLHDFVRILKNKTMAFIPVLDTSSGAERNGQEDWKKLADLVRETEETSRVVVDTREEPKNPEDHLEVLERLESTFKHRDMKPEIFPCCLKTVTSADDPYVDEIPYFLRMTEHMLIDEMRRRVVLSELKPVQDLLADSIEQTTQLLQTPAVVRISTAWAMEGALESLSFRAQLPYILHRNYFLNGICMNTTSSGAIFPDYMYRLIDFQDDVMDIVAERLEQKQVHADMTKYEHEMNYLKGCWTAANVDLRPPFLMFNPPSRDNAQKNQATFFKVAQSFARLRVTVSPEVARRYLSSVFQEELRVALHVSSDRVRDLTSLFYNWGHAYALDVTIGGERQILIEGSDIKDSAANQIKDTLMSLLEDTEETDPGVFRDKIGSLSNLNLNITYGYIGGDTSSYRGPSLDQWLASYKTWKASLGDKRNWATIRKEHIVSVASLLSPEIQSELLKYSPRPLLGRWIPGSLLNAVKCQHFEVYQVRLTDGDFEDGWFSLGETLDKSRALIVKETESGSDCLVAFGTDAKQLLFRNPFVGHSDAYYDLNAGRQDYVGLGSLFHRISPLDRIMDEEFSHRFCAIRRSLLAPCQYHPEPLRSLKDGESNTIWRIVPKEFPSHDFDNPETIVIPTFRAIQGPQPPDEPPLGLRLDCVHIVNPKEVARWR